MRTGPLVDPLIEHPVGDLGRYALENGFHVMVEGTALARADPRARGGCGWVTGGEARPGHQGRGPGRSRRGPPWFCDGPVPPFRRVSWTTDRAGLAHRAREVVLFTNAAHPTSNALYRRIGFVPVTDFAAYDFG
ncbi:GNAT family N-acetyltransferase [Streptomyces sp. LN245]|uniref:GNAT family N-acetyltransferase n=1 Tax=Streptomyces sp. LN245 TaxID=3112975 RepID=UPI0037192EBD